MDFFYANYNMKVAYQKYMEFIHENTALEYLDSVNKAKNKLKLLQTTKWNDIAKIVLTKDKRLLYKILTETNPDYKPRLLETPKSTRYSPRKALRTMDLRSQTTKSIPLLIDNPEPQLQNFSNISTILKAALMLNIANKQK